MRQGCEHVLILYGPKSSICLLLGHINVGVLFNVLYHEQSTPFFNLMKGKHSMNTRIDIPIGHGAEDHHSQQHSPLAQLNGTEAAWVAGGEQDVNWLVVAPISPRSSKA